MLTVKSDDVVGRVKTYEAIVKGENIPEPGIPEGFKVLIKELQALGLDVRLYNNDKELELKEDIEDAIDFNLDEHKKMVSGQKSDVIVDDEVSDNYIDDEEADSEDDYEDSDALFEDMDDSEDEDYILGEDNLLDSDEFDE